MKFAWITLVFLCSCSLLERNTKYSNQNPEVETYLQQKNQYYVYEAQKQLGLDDKTQFNQAEQNLIYWRAALIKEESHLQSATLKEQYYSHKAYFINDKQRLAFLKIDSYADKENYLARYIDTNRYPTSVESAVNAQDLVPRMTKNAVIASWGKPENIEVSGDAVYGNERWTYTNYVESEDGEIEEKRYLFFESGQLVGWETSTN